MPGMKGRCTNHGLIFCCTDFGRNDCWVTLKSSQIGSEGRESVFESSLVKCILGATLRVVSLRLMTGSERRELSGLL